MLCLWVPIIRSNLYLRRQYNISYCLPKTPSTSPTHRDWPDEHVGRLDLISGQTKLRAGHKAWNWRTFMVRWITALAGRHTKSTRGSSKTLIWVTFATRWPTDSNTGTAVRQISDNSHYDGPIKLYSSRVTFLGRLSAVFLTRKIIRSWKCVQEKNVWVLQMVERKVLIET